MANEENHSVEETKAESSKKKTVLKPQGQVKHKILLTTEADHPFSKLLSDLKQRGLKTIDSNKLIASYRYTSVIRC